MAAPVWSLISMWQLSLAMVAGAIAAELTSFAPPTYVLDPVFLTCLAVRIVAGRAAFVGFATGAALCLVAALAAIGDRLQPQFAGDSILTQVEVVEFPRRRGESLSFVAVPVADPRLPRKLRLTWRRPPATPRGGDRWELVLRLRPPRGRMNPGGFDAEEWLFRDGIGATGYVVESARNRLLGSSPGRGLSAARRSIAARIARVVPEPDIAAILTAITTGSRHGLTRAQWDRFARTGTSHLMAISGLHIGLAAAFAYVTAAAMLALCRLRAGSRRPALALAVLVALAYAAVSGFGVPALRALAMFGIAYLALLRGRAVCPCSILSLAVIVVVVGDPLAVGSAGFLLSFAAVACLLWYAALSRDAPPVTVLGRLAVKPLIALRIQLCLFFGLLPLAVALFGRVAPAAPIANLLVVPVFSMVTVPAALTGMALDGPLDLPGDMALRLAAASLGVIDSLLKLDVWQSTAHSIALTTGSLTLALLASAWALLPPGWPGRAASLPAAIAVSLWQPAAVPQGCFRLTMLDVGQGQSVLVETSGSALLYDTGPGWPGGGNLVESAVLPVLRQRGIRALDVTVVSHADLDHAGGLEALANAMPIGRLLGGEPIDKRGLSAASCHGLRHWQRDGVRFEFLSSAAWTTEEGNNRSCVLAVSVGNGRALLTGDIERPVETRLVREHRLRRATLVTVPHHGSDTSSSAALIEATAPELAIVSVGHANRWGMPRPAIVRRWQAHGSRVHTTAAEGALDITVCKDGVSKFARARRDARRIWRMQ
jgi:competence protein ComEC